MNQITHADLEHVTGGAGTGGFKAAAQKTTKVVGKALPGANAFFAGKDAYDGYNDARKNGKGVGDSVGAGVKAAAKSVTLYDLWGASPAY